MRRELEALRHLAKIANEGLAARQTIGLTASILRRATGAAEVILVYAQDQDLLVCSDPSDGASTDFTQIALWVVQRQIMELGGPVAFNLKGHRVEDFTSVASDDRREFLALSVPTTESASEICILRGPWKHIPQAGVIGFMESAMPALAIILERFLNVDRGRRLAEKLSALTNSAQVLTQVDNLETTLTNLATAIARSTASDYVTIDVYNGDTGRFVSRILSESRFARLSLAQAWIGSLAPDRPDAWNLEIMRTHQPLLLPDIQEEEWLPESVRQLFRVALLRSMVIFPMLSQDEFLGTAGFAYYAPHTFSPEQVSFLQGFVTQLATALKAVQMHKELERYAQELKRAADVYVATTNMTGDIIVRLNEHGRWVLLNDAACQFFGRPRDELLGAQSTDYVHPEDVASTTQAIRETRARKELVRGFVHRFLTPMGPRVVEWDAWPLFDEQGQYTGTQITGRDITERKRVEDELAAKTEEYIATTNLTGDIIARLDKRGRWAFLNDAACQFYGKPREELLDTDSRAYIHPEDLEPTALAIRETRGKKALTTGFVNRQVTPAGIRVVEWNGYPLFDEYGDYAGIQITGRDITERRQMEEALKENETRYRLIAESTSDFIWTMDMNLRYTYVSPSITRMRGYTPEEILGATIAQTLTPASLEVARKALAEELAKEKMEDKDLYRPRREEFEVYRKDGSTIWTEMNMIFLRDREGNPVGILGVTRDISERKRMEEERERLQAELEVRAITDGLTGLYNHAHFYRRLAEELERSKRHDHCFAVVMMDVDNFKLFNDSYGHQAGDEALRLVAEGIRSGLRSSDLAFRYGGDEFAAILLDADSAKAQAVVSRIKKRIIRGLKQIDAGTTASLALSAGVACFPNDGRTPDELVRAADAALYGAKWAARARGLTQQEQAIESPDPTGRSAQPADEDTELAPVTTAKPD